MKTKISPTPIFLRDYGATFSPNLSEKRCKVAGNKLKMYASLTEVFVSRYEGNYTLGHSKKSLLINSHLIEIESEII